MEDRVAALEARVKALETALQTQAGKPAVLNAANIDGIYKAVLPNGEAITVVFDKGAVTASSDKGNKAGTYEIIGQRIVISAEGKTEVLTIDGDHLRAEKGSDKIDFIKAK